MTKEEAIVYWSNHYEEGNTEQNDAVYLALQALKNSVVVYDKEELRRLVIQMVKV